MAKAYLLAEVTINNPEGYEAYRSRTGALVDRFGGRFLVRGGTLHPLEGEPDFARLVIIEFPDLEAAQGFYNCDEYQGVLPHRTDNSQSMLLIAEGAD